MDDVRNIIYRRERLRRLKAYLLAHELVEDVYYNSLKFRVKLKCGLKASWYIRPSLIREIFNIPIDPFDGKKIPILQQHQCEPFDSDYHIKKNFPLLRYKDFKKGSFFEKQIAIFRILSKLITIDHIKIPEEELLKDLNRIKDIKFERYYKSNGLIISPSYGSMFHPGWILSQGLTEWPIVDRPLLHLLRNPKLVYRAIYVTLMKKKDIRLQNLLITLHKINIRNARFLTPGIYRAVLRHFGLSNTVIGDPFPDYGMKALSACLEGCVYCAPDVHRLARLGRYIGAEFQSFDKSHYDCILIDGKFRDQIDYNQLDKWRELADSVIIFCPIGMETKLPLPDSFIKIGTYTEDLGFVYHYV